MHHRVMYDGSNIFGWRSDVLDAMSIYSPAMHKSPRKKPLASKIIGRRLKSWRQKTSFWNFCNSKACGTRVLQSPPEAMHLNYDILYSAVTFHT